MKPFGCLNKLMLNFTQYRITLNISKEPGEIVAMRLLSMLRRHRHPCSPRVSLHLPRHVIKRLRIRLAEHVPAMALVSRQQLLNKTHDIENAMRGSLKVFGLRIGIVTRSAFEVRVLELVADHPILLAITEPMLRVRRAMIEAFEVLDRMCRQLARRDPVCRRLMTIPGVGVVVALTYRTGVDAPERFSRSRDVGAHFGLTPRRYSSGQTDFDGRISRCGDEMIRTALYQAAHVLFHHGPWSSLRSWAMRLAKRGSVKVAKVALARRLAVITHRMWTDGTEFRWSATPGSVAA